MPRYDFEYYDDSGQRHVFEDICSVNYDFSSKKSPCGKYDAIKLPPTGVISANGLTLNQKKAGTTKKRIEMGKFMREQRTVRKKNYEPGTRQHDSNEIWTGTEGTDGVTQMPINNEKKED
jgi:hypothetical protein